MNGRPLTDAQIAAGLRAHLPSQALPGLRDRITAQVVATPQARRLPWFLGLGDADPIVRRRTLLLVATVALLAAVAVAAVGAWLESQKQVDPTRVTDVDAFVLSSYAKFTNLPAFRIVIHEELYEDVTYFYDGAGNLREEAGAAITIYTPDFVARQLQLGNNLVWVRTDGAQEPALSTVAGKMWSGPAECAEHWAHLETVELIGRSTHHVVCSSPGPFEYPVEGHMWIDVATGLPLRAGNSAFEPGPAGSPVPADLVSRDIIELEMGSQAADLFVLDGITISPDEYACALSGECPLPSGAAPSAAPTSRPSWEPVVPPPPAASPGVAPADLDAFVAAVYASYEGSESVDIITHPDRSSGDGLAWWGRWRADGLGNFRFGRSLDEFAPAPIEATLIVGGRLFMWDPQPDGRTWHDWGQQPDALVVPLGLPSDCATGWTYLGDDMVMARPAAHIVCGLQEFWIDREWMLVTRAHNHDPAFGDDPGAGLSEVFQVNFGPLPADLFAVPPPDTVWE